MTDADIFASFPPRSVLVPLEPIGIGTPMVESLESYVTRIAAHESVARHRVERVVSRSGAYEIAHDQSRQQLRLDAPTLEWAEFAQRLAALTARPEVARLGLGWLHQWVSRTGALRPHRAWCFICIGAMAEGIRPVYEPLAWSLVACKFCPVHGVPLQTSCAHCGARKLARRVRTNWLDCNTCGKLLSLPSRHERATSSKHAESAFSYERRAAATVGDFLSLAHEVGEGGEPCAPAVARLVTSVLDRGRAVTQAEFARHCKLPKNTVNEAVRGKRARNTFELLVRLATVADVALAGLFDKRYWKSDANAVRLCDIWGIPGESPRRRVDWVAAGRLGEQLLANRTLSPSGLAQALSVDVTQMRSLLPDLYNRSRAAWSSAEAERRSARQAHLTAEVRRVLAEATQNQRRRSARAIAAEVGVRRTSPAFRRAIEEVSTDVSAD